MLGTKLDARAFLDRVADELARIDPGEVKALADAIFVVTKSGDSSSSSATAAAAQVRRISAKISANVRCAARISTTTRKNACAF